MATHIAGIPTEGMIPDDKLSAPATHSSLALRSYIPALDGVRGLAIIAVMFCHFVWFAPVTESYPIPDRFGKLAVQALQAGRYGVDLFFVLSGFLITGILYDSKKDKHYFRNFYARRTLRIFPLYYSVLAMVFVILPLLMSFNSIGDQQIIRNQGWLWAYMSNIRSAFWSEGPDFWQQDKLWLGHFWSLAIEEQFYLVWPLVILLLSRQSAMKACVVMIFGAPVLRIVLFWTLQPPAGSDAPPIGLYAALYFTLSKLDTLALGALLALAARSPGGITSYVRVAPWTLIFSALLLAPLLVFKPLKAGISGALTESGKLSLICVFCGSLLVLAVSSTPKQFFGWIFTQPIMRFFGKYSYALYIFHELLAPLFNGKLGAESLSRTLGIGNWYVTTLIHIALAFAISIALALISWNLLEKHLLKLKRFFEHAPQHAPERRIQTGSAGMPVAAPRGSSAVLRAQDFPG